MRQDQCELESQVKGLLQSKTVWGCIVTILCMILMQFDIQVDEGVKGELVNQLVALGGVIASIFAIYGRVKADTTIKIKKVSSKKKSNLMIVFILVTPLLVSACAFSNLSPDQQALGAGEELRLQYLSLHHEYQQLYNNPTTSEDLKQTMRSKVAPVMNTAKDAIVLYRDAALIYASFKNKPENYDRLKEDAEDAFQNAAVMMLELMNSDWSE
ncbi:hypothetical protein [Halodesulfovibrio aestuarii]|uniref:hypothetical protein n=1 Tax=Halodesulfovibrio aestuarii TaxID=126333 RepID=UPI000488844E